MTDLKLLTYLCLVLAIAVAESAVGAAPSASTTIAMIDLSKSFDTRSIWHFIALQGAPVEDPVGMGGRVPAGVQLCLRRDASEACDPDLQGIIHSASKGDPYSEPHYLNKVQILRPRGNAGRSILLVQIASVHSVDGDQVVSTQALVYRHDVDQFIRVYENLNLKNNNEEVCYIDIGPLQGDIISAEQTLNAPFGFWISVNAIRPDHAHRQVLRYHSATKYGDGNPLPVQKAKSHAQREFDLWRDRVKAVSREQKQLA